MFADVVVIFAVVVAVGVVGIGAVWVVLLRGGGMALRATAAAGTLAVGAGEIWANWDERDE
jgi:hypothetical protein